MPHENPKAFRHEDLAWHLVKPHAGMGHAVAKLVERCPPLDRNSVYCNLLQCHHFAGTSIAAVGVTGELLGFVSAYRVPERPNTLFVWQVAVDPRARQRGLAYSMLTGLLRRSQCLGISFIETTVTESNLPSENLFRHLAEQLDAPIRSEVLFDQHTHFAGQHDSERLLCIGPFLMSSLPGGDDENF